MIREEGLQRGREEGREQGRREMLQALLDAKFGPLPEDAIARLTSAAADELGHWLKRLLNASTLDEVFDTA